MGGIVDTERFILKIPKPETEGGFRPLGAPPLVTFETRRVGPPSNVYIERDDLLRVRMYGGSVTAGQLNLRGRLLRAADGKLVRIDQQMPAVPAFSTVNVFLDLAEGYLLGLIGELRLGFIERGQLLVEFSIVRPPVVTPVALQVLARDYVTDTDSLVWPGGRVQSSLEGPGNLRVAVLGNPALGADFLVALNNAQRWRVQSVNATLTTSAAVGSRQPFLVTDDTVNRTGTFGQNQAIPASTAGTFVWGAGMSPAAAALSVGAGGLPSPLLVRGGHRLFSSTSGLDVGDQWSSIAITVEEWVDPFGF